MRSFFLAIFLTDCHPPTATETGTPPVTSPYAAANSRDYLPRALEMMAGATSHIHVVEFEIYEGPSVSALLSAMVEAHNRGVDVKLLADEEVGGTPPVVTDLKSHGVDAKLDSPDTTTHNKLIIADDAVLVGSTNWSDSSIDYNNEGDLYVTDTEIVAWYEAYFQALWADSSVQPTIPWEGTGAATPWSNPRTREGLLTCLDNATSEIAVVMYAMMYYAGEADSVPTQLVEALVDARARGVAVKVLLDRSDWIRQNHINDQAAFYLESQGIDLRFTPHDEITHAKVVTCDQRVFLGDANWSTSGLMYYQGTSIEVDDPDLAVAYRSWFMELWARGSS